MARWPHKQTSREGSGMCLRPSGFPGALFLFSGLLSLTELLQSLAFGESPVGNQKFLFTTALAWIYKRLSPVTALRFNSRSFGERQASSRLKRKASFACFNPMDQKTQRTVVAAQQFPRGALSRKSPGASSKAAGPRRDSTVLPADESSREAKSRAQKPA